MQSTTASQELCATQTRAAQSPVETLDQWERISCFSALMMKMTRPRCWLRKSGKGGSGEATLGGVDRGEDCGNMNIRMLSLKMEVEVPMVNPGLALFTIKIRMSVLTFWFWLWVKRKQLGYFLQASQMTPWRGGSLDGRSNPDQRDNVVGWLLRSLCRKKRK